MKTMKKMPMKVRKIKLGVITCVDCSKITTNDPFYLNRCGECLAKFKTEQWEKE